MSSSYSFFRASTIFRYVIVPIATASVIQTTFCDIRAVKGRSMSPTLSPNYHETGARDFVLIDKYSHFYRRGKELRRGQIVAYWCPHNPERMSIKRIVGIEGDVVFRDVRRVGSEHRMLEAKGYTDATKMGFKMQEPVVKVPKMGVWVEGDYWRESLDSNDLGAVTSALVIGTAVAVVWPPSRWQWLNKPRQDGGDITRSVVKPGDIFMPPSWVD